MWDFADGPETERVKNTIANNLLKLCQLGDPDEMKM